MPMPGSYPAWRTHPYGQDQRVDRPGLTLDLFWLGQDPSSAGFFPSSRRKGARLLDVHEPSTSSLQAVVPMRSWQIDSALVSAASVP